MWNALYRHVLSRIEWMREGWIISSGLGAFKWKSVGQCGRLVECDKDEDKGRAVTGTPRGSKSNQHHASLPYTMMEDTIAGARIRSMTCGSKTVDGDLK